MVNNSFICQLRGDEMRMLQESMASIHPERTRFRGGFRDLDAKLTDTGTIDCAKVMGIRKNLTRNGLGSRFGIALHATPVPPRLNIYRNGDSLRRDNEADIIGKV